VYTFSMERKKALGLNVKYLKLCSEEEQVQYIQQNYNQLLLLQRVYLIKMFASI